MGSYQIAVEPALFAEVVPWLSLNRGGLDVFVHPNTGDGRTDHTDHVLFIARYYRLDVTVFERCGVRWPGCRRRPRAAACCAPGWRSCGRAASHWIGCLFSRTSIAARREPRTRGRPST